jgi:Zn-dependent protease with chaperone function
VKGAGDWSGGDVAALVPAELEFDGEYLVVRTADGATVLARWPVVAVRIDAVLEGSTAYLESPADPGRTVSTTDETLLGALRAAGAGGARRARVPPRRRMQLALGFAAAAGAIFAGLYAALPSIAHAIAVRVPYAVERRLEPEVQAIFASNTCRTPEADAAVEALRARIDPTRSVPADVSIVNIGQANAFALPGGSVLLTRGLVEEAASGEEVAGVLAHELAHVRHRHVLAELIQDTFMSGVWAVAFGDYSGLLVVDPRTVEHLVELRHTRAAEAEADRTGLDMLVAALVSPADLATFLERNQLGAAEGYLTFLSNHPATADRIAVIRSVHVADGPPVLTPEQLDALHNACSSVPAPKTLREIVGWPRKSQSAPSSSPGPSSSPPTAPSPAPSARAK